MYVEVLFFYIGLHINYLRVCMYILTYIYIHKYILYVHLAILLSGLGQHNVFALEFQFQLAF